MPRDAVPTVTGCGETLAGDLCTTVVEPSKAPLEAAIATVTTAATTPAAKPTAAAKGADRMRRRLDDRFHEPRGFWMVDRYPP